MNLMDVNREYGGQSHYALSGTDFFGFFGALNSERFAGGVAIIRPSIRSNSALSTFGASLIRGFYLVFTN